MKLLRLVCPDLHGNHADVFNADGEKVENVEEIRLSVSRNGIRAEVDALSRIQPKPGFVQVGLGDDVSVLVDLAVPVPAKITMRDPAEPKRPVIVCLCGSTRFWRTFQEAGLRETLAGKIVLSIGAASGTDDEHFGNLPPEHYAAVKAKLDELHLHKIKMADEVLVLNVGNYVGESTLNELRYAVGQRKRMRFWEDPGASPRQGAWADLAEPEASILTWHLDRGRKLDLYASAAVS